MIVGDEMVCGRVITKGDGGGWELTVEIPSCLLIFDVDAWLLKCGASVAEKHLEMRVYVAPRKLTVGLMDEYAFRALGFPLRPKEPNQDVRLNFLIDTKLTLPTLYVIEELAEVAEYSGDAARVVVVSSDELQALARESIIHELSEPLLEELDV